MIKLESDYRKARIYFFSYFLLQYNLKLLCSISVLNYKKIMGVIL